MSAQTMREGIGRCCHMPIFELGTGDSCKASVISALDSKYSNEELLETKLVVTEP